MMMRYLGWGIGHHNPAEFCHEANSLIASNSDRELAQFGDPVGDSAGAEGDSDLDVISDGECESSSDLDVDAPLETFEY